MSPSYRHNFLSHNTFSYEGRRLHPIQIGPPHGCSGAPYIYCLREPTLQMGRYRRQPSLKGDGLNTGQSPCKMARTRAQNSRMSWQTAGHATSAAPIPMPTAMATATAPTSSPGSSSSAVVFRRRPRCKRSPNRQRSCCLVVSPPSACSADAADVPSHHT